MDHPLTCWTAGLDWAHHMNLPAVIAPALEKGFRSGSNHHHDHQENHHDQENHWPIYAATLLRHLRQASLLPSFQLWIPVALHPDRLREFDMVYRLCDNNHQISLLLTLEPLASSSSSSSSSGRANPHDCLAEQLQLLHLALGRPVRAVAISCDLFMTNKSGYPTLSKSHQILLMELFKRIGRTIRVLLVGPSQHTASLPPKHLGQTGCMPYLHYIQHLRNRPEVLQALNSEEAKLETDYLDTLQVPLQPLKDHLEFMTYETFEKDPVKYQQYQTAIFMALQDRQQQQLSTPSSVTIFVVGAGRGPLVTCALQAYEALIASSPQAATTTTPGISVIAVEKNPSAIVYLLSKQEYDPLWKKYGVQIVARDLRSLTLEHCGGTPADLVVSELLGSFGDNELSPECLDAFFRTECAHAQTISIPMRYTALVAPVSSAKLYNQAKSQALYPNHDESDVHGLQKAMETPYVVRPHAVSQTHPEQECWTFTHPTDRPDASRVVTLDFAPHPPGAGCGLGSGYGPRCAETERKATLSSSVPAVSTAWTLSGFLGTFTADLYYRPEGEQLCQISNAPSTFSKGMFSWFPLFFPLKEPVHVPANATVRLYLWRCVDTQCHKVWYEWSVLVHRDTEVLSMTPIHNPAGRSYHVSLT